MGVAYALRPAGLAGYGVRVTRIVGLSSDTNPTIVAAAAARAVWSGAGVTPDAAIRARMEVRVLASFGRGVKACPSSRADARELDRDAAATPDVGPGG